MVWVDQNQIWHTEMVGYYPVSFVNMPYRAFSKWWQWKIESNLVTNKINHISFLHIGLGKRIFYIQHYFISNRRDVAYRYWWYISLSYGSEDIKRCYIMHLCYFVTMTSIIPCYILLFHKFSIDLKTLVEKKILNLIWKIFLKKVCSKQFSHVVAIII